MHKMLLNARMQNKRYELTSRLFQPDTGRPKLAFKSPSRLYKHPDNQIPTYSVMDKS